MDIATSASSITAISDKSINALFELSKSNIDKIDLWFTLMLGIAGIILTIIALLLGLIAYLTWKHIGQARKADKLLIDVENKNKQISEYSQAIIDDAKQKTAKQQKLNSSTNGLSKKEVAETAQKHRGFRPVLIQAVGENPVFAIDNQGYKHHIPNIRTLIRMGYSGSDIKQISKVEIDQIPTGENIPDLS